ncbi:histidinol phosphate phosphatase HisJ family protein [Pseudomassariella vexata]|uniref:Histidinol-phosphatase n=1 Tax=Pseudomassariella vexata TaxID=1141098 RepID=A0A1Y2E0S1_9PEZI|nr:histidinol phosphate phosphatase HisJ family protein [Pseudomassariella vexata]ORY65130.1 histidinol phosphate phosphatase HisJ family protein [Pseudomassariella vexata]
MAFTMHSHSGQFCPGHAKDQLEDIIKHAISLGFTTMGLTEHMPRTGLDDLYPEELDNPEQSLAELGPRHEAYLVEAQRLQAAYASEIHLLIGFEGEWLRPSYGPLIKSLASHPCIDYFMGSLHHVNAIPIDFDSAYYQKAVESAGGTEERLYEKYYDEQFEMLEALKPRVVGHFDLCRLLSAEPGRDVREWKGVWERIVRNLQFVAEYGGWLECNSSALRKGLVEPYPCRAIAEEWLSRGGKFTLSDDSHGIAQVATNYKRALEYLESLGVSTLMTLERIPPTGVAHENKATLVTKEVPVSTVKRCFE